MEPNKASLQDSLEESKQLIEKKGYFAHLLSSSLKYGESTVIRLTKNEGNVVKIYKHKESFYPVLLTYHYIQNKLSKLGTIKIKLESPIKVDQQEFNEISVNILPLDPNSIGIGTGLIAKRTKMERGKEHVVSNVTYVPGNTLHDYWKDNNDNIVGILTKEEVLGICDQIVGKLETLSGIDLSFNDEKNSGKNNNLKPVNIKVSHDNGTLTLTITDLGESVVALVEKNKKRLDKVLKEDYETFIDHYISELDRFCESEKLITGGFLYNLVEMGGKEWLEKLVISGKVRVTKYTIDDISGYLGNGNFLAYIREGKIPLDESMINFMYKYYKTRYGEALEAGKYIKENVI